MYEAKQEINIAINYRREQICWFYKRLRRAVLITGCANTGNFSVIFCVDFFNDLAGANGVV